MRAILGFLILILLFLVFTFPASWLLMLFLGNVGVHVGYWGAFPLGILVSVLLAGTTSHPSSNIFVTQRSA